MTMIQTELSSFIAVVNEGCTVYQDLHSLINENEDEIRAYLAQLDKQREIEKLESELEYAYQQKEKFYMQFKAIQHNIIGMKNKLESLKKDE